MSAFGALAATGCGDHQVRLWSLRSFACLTTLEHGPTESTRPPAGKSPPRRNGDPVCVRLLGSVLISGGQDWMVRLFTIDRSARCECVAMLNHGANVRGVTASPLGFIASVGSTNPRTLAVWRPEKQGLLGRVFGR